MNAQVEVIEEPQAEEEVVDNPRAKNIQELFLEYSDEKWENSERCHYTGCG